MRKIIICATQRCGSTLLCKELEATGVLGKPKEFYLKAASLLSKEDADEFLNRMLAKGSTANRVFAVKVMQDQWPLMSSAHQLVAARSAQFYSKFFHRKRADFALNEFQLFYKNAAWVYLQRQDIVAQAVSREMAVQTNICHVVKEGTSKAGLGAKFGHCLEDSQIAHYNAQASYDFERILTHVRAIKREEFLWMQFFSSYNIKPLALSYERIVTAKDYRAEIAKKINVDLPAKRIDSPLVKLANEMNEEWTQLFKQDLQAKQYLL